MAVIHPIFTAGADSFKTTNAADTYELDFLGGNDSLEVVAGTVTSRLGTGNDSAIVRGGSATINGDAGNDLFTVFGGTSTINGGTGMDRLIFRQQANVSANLGDDNDRVDFYVAVLGINIIGGAGNDTFFGNSYFHSGSIYGGSGNDLFYGFRTGVGLHGGTGDDTYRVDPLGSASFFENLGEGTDTVQVQSGQSYTLPFAIENLTVMTFGSIVGPTLLGGNDLNNIIRGGDSGETISGLDGNDQLFGNDGDDVLLGENGDDLINAGAANDMLNGGPGNDILIGGLGADIMVGGIGDDIYYVDNYEDAVVETNFGNGIDTVRTSYSFYQLPSFVDNLEATDSLSHTFIGNELDNVMTGKGGSDYLEGGSGNDHLIGGDGVDDLRGGSGQDNLEGGNGDDQLHGGGSNDVLDGGAGADQLWGDGGYDQITGGAGQDHFSFVDGEWLTSGGYATLLDFHSSSGAGPDDDLLDLSAIDANATAFGDQAFTVITGAFTNTAGELSYSVTANPDGSADFIFYGDTDGDGFANFEFHVHAVNGNIWGDDLII